MAATFVDASFAVDERTSGWIRIIIKVKGLKVKKQGGLFSKKKVAINATIDEPRFGSRYVLVRITGKDGLCNNNIQLEIQRLPYDVQGESSYIEADEDRVLVFLKKADSGQSWISYIDGNGIETED